MKKTLKVILTMGMMLTVLLSCSQIESNNVSAGDNSMRVLTVYDHKGDIIEQLEGKNIEMGSKSSANGGFAVYINVEVDGELYQYYNVSVTNVPKD